MSTTNCHLDYPCCKARNCWCSIDAHFQNGAVTILLSMLSIRAASSLDNHNSNQSSFQWPHFDDQRSVTFHGQVFAYIAHSSSAAIDNYIQHDLNSLVTFLTYWDLALWQGWAQYYSCTVYSYSSKIYIYCWMIYFAQYTLYYQPKLICDCAPFSSNLSAN